MSASSPRPPLVQAAQGACARFAGYSARVRPSAMGVVAAASVGAYAGGALAVEPLWASAGFAACALVVLALRRATVRAVAFGALAFAITGLRARAAIVDAEHAHARAAVELASPARCDGEATILRSPVAQSGGGREPMRMRADVKLEGLACVKRPRRAPAGPDDGSGAVARPLDQARITPDFVARIYGVPEHASRGDRLKVRVDLAPTHLFHNEGLRTPYVHVARSQVVASGTLRSAARLEQPASAQPWVAAALSAPARAIDRARAFVRVRIEETFHADAAPLARALVLGEADLVADDDEAFRKSGLAHLLAVSGSHLVLAVAAAAAALQAILARVPAIAARVDPGRVVSAAAALLAFAYADFAGGSGSAMRAAYMLGASMLARALGRRPTAERSLSLSLLAGACADPLVALDASFALSAAATFGLVFLAAPIERAAADVGRRVCPRRVAGSLFGRAAGKLGAALATSAAAIVACAPVLAMMTPELPLVGLVANLVAAPLGELFALPVCLLHAIASPVPAIESGAALVGSGALLAVRAVALDAAATGAVLVAPDPTPPELAIAAALALVSTLPRGKGSRLSRRARVVLAGSLAAGLVAAEAHARASGAPLGLLRVTVLDVGQGDAVLVDLPDGSALLVDAGGLMGSPVDTGARVVLPALRARRREQIRVALSHPHPDHFGGLRAVVARARVTELWDTGQGRAEGAGPVYASLVAKALVRGVPVVGPETLCGAPRSLGGATLEVLAPCPAHQTGVDANDNSFVFRITHGRRSALFVGDSERDAEHALVEREGDRLGADFLKVGHHGSRTSTTQTFLDAVRPRDAAISSGVRNSFGHPHAEVLARLSAAGVRVHRTDQGGSVTWTTDGDRTWVERPRGGTFR